MIKKIVLAALVLGVVVAAGCNPCNTCKVAAPCNPCGTTSACGTCDQ